MMTEGPTEHGPAQHATGDAPKPKGTKKKKGRPPRGKKSPRPTTAELQARVLEVMELLVKGYRRRDILRHVANSQNSTENKDAKRRWTGVAERTVDDYMARATAELTKIADEPRNVAKSKARARYEKVIREASAAEQWEVVRKANRDLARLDGLEPGLRVQHAGVVEVDHTGEVNHEHTHHAAGSLEDRASRVSNLLATAHQRRLAATSGNN